MDDAFNQWGDNLVSIIQYGTEGEPENKLIVLKKIDRQVLESLKHVIAKQKVKQVPVFFTKKELQNGADVFPLEFLDMKYPHKVLHGEDTLKSLKIEKKHVRRQLEFEFRSKLIHLRENYVALKKDKDMEKLLSGATPSIMPLLYGLLHLKDVEPPTQLDALFEAVKKEYEFDIDILQKVRQSEKSKLKHDQLVGIVHELIDFFQQSIAVMEKMDGTLAK